MTYTEAVRYLAGTIGFGINPGLERIEALCERLGHPERAYPVIQITGTNGKTTTARAITAILAAHGRRVGTYTSPHLSFYTERISVNGRPMDKRAFGRRLEALHPLVEAIERDSAPERCTHFEILTAMAYEYFRDREVDAAVVEVGMGGRWDATSVAVPKVGVLTNVELEHTDRLGSTVQRIAIEKSFVIKGGTEAVVGTVSGRVAEILRSRAVEVGGNVRFLGLDFDFHEETRPTRARAATRARSVTGSRAALMQAMTVDGVFGTYGRLPVPLGGEYQLINLTLAIGAAELAVGGKLTGTRLAEALAGLTSPGRLELVRKRPQVVLDGAHNPAALRRLAEALPRHFEYERLIVVFSVLEDKDIPAMLAEIVRMRPHRVVITSNVSERAARPREVAVLAKEHGLAVRVEPRIGTAIEWATKEAAGRDLVCVTGSLYLVGPARELLRA